MESNHMYSLGRRTGRPKSKGHVRAHDPQYFAAKRSCNVSKSKAGVHSMHTPLGSMQRIVRTRTRHGRLRTSSQPSFLPAVLHGWQFTPLTSTWYREPRGGKILHWHPWRTHWPMSSCVGDHAAKIDIATLDCLGRRSTAASGLLGRLRSTALCDACLDLRLLQPLAQLLHDLHGGSVT